MIFYYDSPWCPDPGYSMNLYFHSKSFVNYSNYNNPKVDQLIDDAARTADTDARLQMMDEAQKIVMAEAPGCSACSPTTRWPAGPTSRAGPTTRRTTSASRTSIGSGSKGRAARVAAGTRGRSVVRRCVPSDEAEMDPVTLTARTRDQPRLTRCEALAGRCRYDLSGVGRSPRQAIGCVSCSPSCASTRFRARLCDRRRRRPHGGGGGPRRALSAGDGQPGGLPAAAQPAGTCSAPTPPAWTC